MKMKLDIKKVKKLKKAYDLTWQDIADAAGLKSRQAIYDYIRTGSPNGARYFAKAFGVKPKDLIL